MSTWDFSNVATDGFPTNEQLLAKSVSDHADAEQLGWGPTGPVAWKLNEQETVELAKALADNPMVAYYISKVASDHLETQQRSALHAADSEANRLLRKELTKRAGLWKVVKQTFARLFSL